MMKYICLHAHREESVHKKVIFRVLGLGAAHKMISARFSMDKWDFPRHQESKNILERGKSQDRLLGK